MNHQVIILIDSGSTLNFLDAKLVVIIGSQTKGQDAIKVRVANGQEIVSPGNSRDVNIKMQGSIFQVDLYILPLASCDVVLGIQWLCILGPFLWDFFVSLTMEFAHGNDKYLLKGLQQRPNLSMEDAEYFRLSRKESKGVLLQLMGKFLLL